MVRTLGTCASPRTLSCVGFFFNLFVLLPSVRPQCINFIELCQVAIFTVSMAALGDAKSTAMTSTVKEATSQSSVAVIGSGQGLLDQ